MTPILHSVSALKPFLEKEKPSRVCIVTSKKALPHVRWALQYLKKLKPSVILIPDGEKAKQWHVLEQLLKDFSRHGLDRESIVVVFGGGTVGDLVGFAASIYMRGIRYVQVPTTLVAQVDSAHGGKTGIDFLGAKNQIGAFYLANTIVVDHRFIHSLSKSQIVDGLGEIIKYGLIKDPSILFLLAKEKISSIQKSSKLGLLIQKSIEVKDYYTLSDFKEKSSRIMLNFGHTYGHAIELKYGFSHGHAVIIGMLAELQLGEKLGITPTSVRKNLLTLLHKLGIDVGGQFEFDPRLLDHDKKVKGKVIVLPVIVKEGNAKLIAISTRRLKDLFSTI